MQKKYISFLIVATLYSYTTAIAQDTTKAKLLNEVVITGQYKPQSLKTSVYQIKIVNAERIKLSGATNVQQVLNNQLGFRFSNDNFLGLDVSINGMSGRNVKILLDGVPVLDRADERNSLNQIDINTIERIEIVEGPMAVSFGSDAMAGVINIITKKQLQNNFAITANMQEETAGKEYHIFNYKGIHTQSLNISSKINNFYLSVGGSHNAFSGFGGDQYGRNKLWLPKEQYFNNVKIGFKKNKLDIYYRLDGMAEKIKDRNVINYDLATAFDQYFYTNRLMQQLQSNLHFNEKLSLVTTASFTNFKKVIETKHHNFVNNSDTLGTLEGQQDTSKLNSFSFKNTFQYAISSKLALQSGIDINHEKASGDRIVGNPFINDYAFFASAEYKPNNKINIRPGLRIVKNSLYKAPPIIPSINTKFVLSNKLDLRISYGYGFRAPVLRELFFNFVDINHNIVGNPNLKAESSNSFNGSLVWSVHHLKALKITSTLNGFYNYFKEQIQLVPNKLDSMQYSYYNISQSKTKGFSIDTKIYFKNIEASIGFAYIGYYQQYDASNYKNDNSKFYFTPEINSNIVYKLNKLKTSLGLFYKFVGVKPALSYERNVTPIGYYLTKTNSYNLADFTITTTANKNFAINAGVKNIFDITTVNSNTDITSNVSHNNSGALSVNYGRSYFIGITFQFLKK
ncbi:MAG: TonB-dependent receptor [Ferruginibacter sp.]|nr:TonB-dependent receptor [Ferruginibacter sp.]